MKNLLLLLFSITVLAGCANSTDNGYDDSADLEFLEEYRLEEGVIETDSGLLYKVLEEGEGDSPTSESVVFVDYTIRLVNDESAENSEFFRLDHVFEGLSEGLQLMNAGAVYELVLPTELVNNDGRVVIYEIELTSFLMDPEDFLEQNAQEEDIVVTDSGLQYRIIEEGEGEKPGPASHVSFKYKGSYPNGYIFQQTTGNDTFDRNVNALNPGLTEGLQLMNEGGMFEFFIPANLGYDDDPPQYGNVIVFEIELVDIQ